MNDAERAKEALHLTSIDSKNIIETTRNVNENSAGHVSPTSSPTSSSYFLRNRRATQGKLVYDAKYHPMDDSVRPSQAAKRRFLHEEAQCFSDDTAECVSLHSETDEEDGRDKQLAEQPDIFGRSNKRSRHRSRSPQPTRRSPRKTTNPGLSYNTSIHPQDRDLELSSADEYEYKSATPPSTQQAHKRLKKTNSVSSVSARTGGGSAVEAGSAKTNAEEYQPQSHGESISGTEEVADVPEEQASALIRTSSPLSSVATPLPHGVWRGEVADVWTMKPKERYFRHTLESWPNAQGLPFGIYTECLEDQLAAEANAASPLSFEEDDKENEVKHSTIEEATVSTRGISIIPLSQYRRTSEDKYASEAFYGLERALTQPYGLGGGDGIHEHDDEGMIAEAMRILTSGDTLPRESGKEKVKDVDCVQGLLSNASVSNNTDSGLGPRSST